MFEEFALTIFEADDSPEKERGREVYIHGHGHATSLVGNTPTEEALQRAGLRPRH